MADDISHLFASAKDGASIQLPPGRHVVGSPIILTRSIRVRGADDGSTVLDGAGACTLFMLLGNGHTYTFETLTFQSGAGRHGGAIAAPNRNAIAFEGCRFSDNRADTAGAACVLHHMKGHFRRCIFERNTSTCGGALAVGTDCDLLLDGCLFVENQAEAGGAIFLDDTAALEVRSCTFHKNRASRPSCGHAMFVFGNVLDGPSAFIANSVFAGAEALSGDPGEKGMTFVTHSVIPRDLFPRKGFKDVGGNILGDVDLVDAEPGLGLWTLAPGSPARGTADAKRIPPGSVDILGAPFVENGRASPGAIAPKS